jgi:hypothetical protein
LKFNVVILHSFNIKPDRWIKKSNKTVSHCAKGEMQLQKYHPTMHVLMNLEAASMYTYQGATTFIYFVYNIIFQKEYVG